VLNPPEGEAMDPSKTRIWRGGLSELVAGTGAAHSGADERGPSSVPRLFDGRLADSPASALHATRILPIERLLPAPPAPAEPEHPVSGELPAVLASPPPPAATKTRRYAGHVLVGFLTLIAVAVWKMPPLAARSAVRAKPLTDQPVLVANTDEPPPQPEAAAAEPTPPPPPRPAPRDPKALQRLRSLERAAVDALVAGDHAAARRIYGELSQANPEAAAFRDAARILTPRP
jgi:hypothetical protein